MNDDEIGGKALVAVGDHQWKPTELGCSCGWKPAAALAVSDAYEMWQKHAKLQDRLARRKRSVMSSPAQRAVDRIFQDIRGAGGGSWLETFNCYSPRGLDDVRKRWEQIVEEEHCGEEKCDAKD